MCIERATTLLEDLLKELDKELSSGFERVVLLWTLDPAEREAFLVNEAIKRLTTSNWVLMEIACTSVFKCAEIIFDRAVPSAI
ncbi:hypothetical protein F0562_007431 [Nyssa sinensis]|uniref:Uncharacterized protein n=1 Tax=Nyssa sinensis TaxID=561372 RepID=A0A5J5A6L1_9ASTE|nr:hypothetical protein F0562_007431 [Nyssa sinensis]